VIRKFFLLLCLCTFSVSVSCFVLLSLGLFRSRAEFQFPFFRFWHFQNDFTSGLVSGELLVSPLVLSLSLFCPFL